MPKSRLRARTSRSSTAWCGLLDLEQIETGHLPRASARRSRCSGCSAARSPGRRSSRPAAPSTADRPVHSLHSYFIRPGDPTIPIVYEVDRVRDGRSFSTRRVIAIQHGKTIFTLSASFQLDQGGIDHQPTMPDVPAAGDAADACTSARGRRRRGRGLRARCRGPSTSATSTTRRGCSARTGRGRRAAPGVDAGRRRAARRPAAARLRADLRLRHDAARLGADPPRPGRRGSTRSRWPRSTTRCGSTGRSAPTSGCSTSTTSPSASGGRGLATGGSSPATAGRSSASSKRA